VAFTHGQPLTDFREIAVPVTFGSKGKQGYLIGSTFNFDRSLQRPGRGGVGHKTRAQ
jgi:hypothetical protein